MLDDEELWKKLGEFGFDPAPPPDVGEQDTPEGIIPLGHDRGVYYYLSKATGQVEAISASQHTRPMLAHLASEAHYWQRTIHAGEKGVDWNAAADDLRCKCRAIGIYDPDRLRGRGAWLDGERTVLHLGDKLIVDGQESSLMLEGSRFVYEAARSMDIELSKPLSSREASGLMDLCTAVSWHDPESMGRILAGWLVIASICGAMRWRPHLWITSDAGGGKTWVMDNIVKPTLGALALYVQGKTTEPALRAALRTDARTVSFDEAESQNERDLARMQQVLDLARQASTEDGPDILKGTQPGGFIRYRIRSCFVFSSINVGLAQAADESRTVVLEMRPPSDPQARLEAFERLKQVHARVMTPEFGSRLLARSVGLIPVIRTNSEIFAQAIARHTGSRRSGDTLGVILAGFWSLRSNKVASVAEADELVSGREWVRTAASWAENEPECQRALSTLLQARERVVNSNGRAEDISVGELVETSVYAASPGQPIRPEDATLALSRMGIKVKDLNGDPSLWIGNHSKACERIYAGTPWAAGWLKTLSRIPGSKPNVGVIKVAGTVQRALAIPLSQALKSDER